MTSVLAIDPGAQRAGWSVLEQRNEGNPTHVASGVVHFPRLPKQKFQEYRMALTEHWVEEGFDLMEEYKPDVLVSEIVPPLGANNGTQLYLANVQIAVLHAIAISYGVKVVQVSARSVQAKIALRKQDVKVTKPQVRQGVLERFPEIETVVKEEMKVFERTDAIAIGAYWFEYM
jgi:Holliday junction resolvasome RuvABC endonuclease subunit